MGEEESSSLWTGRAQARQRQASLGIQHGGGLFEPPAGSHAALARTAEGGLNGGLLGTRPSADAARATLRPERWTTSCQRCPTRRRPPSAPAWARWLDLGGGGPSEAPGAPRSWARRSPQRRTIGRLCAHRRLQASASEGMGRGCAESTPHRVTVARGPVASRHPVAVASTPQPSYPAEGRPLRSPSCELGQRTEGLSEVRAQKLGRRAAEAAPSGPALEPPQGWTRLPAWAPAASRWPAARHSPKRPPLRWWPTPSAAQRRGCALRSHYRRDGGGWDAPTLDPALEPPLGWSRPRWWPSATSRWPGGRHSPKRPPLRWWTTPSAAQRRTLDPALGWCRRSRVALGTLPARFAVFAVATPWHWRSAPSPRHDEAVMRVRLHLEASGTLLAESQENSR